MHRGRVKKNTTPPLGTGRVLSRQLRTARNGIRRDVEGGRQWEEGTPGRANPGDDRELSTGRGRKRGSNRTREIRHRIAQGTPLGPTDRGGKRRQAAVVIGQGNCTGGRSLRNWVLQKERGAASTVERGGVIGYRLSKGGGGVIHNTAGTGGAGR